MIIDQWWDWNRFKCRALLSLRLVLSSLTDRQHKSEAQRHLLLQKERVFVNHFWKDGRRALTRRRRIEACVVLGIWFKWVCESSSLEARGGVSWIVPLRTNTPFWRIRYVWIPRTRQRIRRYVVYSQNYIKPGDVCDSSSLEGSQEEV